MQKTRMKYLLVITFLSLFCWHNLYAQDRIIKGLVISGTDNEPLIGVTVKAKGFGTGVITDIDGNYSITVPANAKTLVATYVGMRETEVVITGPVVNITMQDNQTELDEVVVIGYGVQKRRDLTGAITSVKGEDLVASPVSNVAQALQGKMSGVNVTTMDGRPDAEMKIRVRGGTSITQNNDPLYIVDGFTVGSIADIPGDQIASIDVLKDASSTAIYGARGANGVVLITTKSPKSGRLTITYDGYAQFKRPTKRQKMLDPYDYVVANWEYDYLLKANNGETWARAMGIGNYSNWTEGSITINNPQGIDAYKNISSSNPEKSIIDNAFSQSHNVSINGGTDKTKYNLSFNYLSDEGIKMASSFKRMNVMAKLSQEIVKNLKFDFDARYSRRTAFGDEGYRNSVGSNINRSVRYIAFTPLGDVSDANSKLNMDNKYISPDYKPSNLIADVYNKRVNENLRANVALTWDIISGLTYRTEFSMNQNKSNKNYFEGHKYRASIDASDAKASVDNSESYGYRYVNTLNYNIKGLGEKHDLNVMIGQELLASGLGSKRTSVTVQGFSEAYDAKKALAMLNQYKREGSSVEPQIYTYQGAPTKLASFFGRVNYSLLDKYLITATLRADGSSRFARGNRWGYFPAAAVAWRLSDEEFMASTKGWLDNLKVRLSLGQVGNDNIDASGLIEQYFTPITDNKYLYSEKGVLRPGYGLASDLMPNEKLKWETTVTRNFGLDYSFGNGRLYGGIELYLNTTKDLLMTANLPGYTGYVRRMENVGEVENRGIELSIGSEILKAKDYSLSVNFNIGFNKNEITKLNNEYKYTSGWGSSSTKPDEYILRQGKPIGIIRGYVHDGFYTTDDFNYNPTTKKYTLKPGVADNSKIIGGLPSGAYPGQIKYKKMSGSGDLINEKEDVVEIGDTNPLHTGGFNISGTYKNFDLFVGFNWSYGNDIVNVNKMVSSYGGKTPYRNWDKSFKDRYRIFDIQGGQLVRITDPEQLKALNKNAKTYMPYHEQPVLTSEAIEDGSFLRLNNITLGYTFPKSLTKKFSVEKLRIYTTIYNVYVWTDYSGYDPEVDTGSNMRSTTLPMPGLDFGSYPKARTFTFGVNLSF